MVLRPGRDWSNTTILQDRHNDSWVELAYHEKDHRHLGSFHRYSPVSM
jgi:hypothetical protein